MTTKELLQQALDALLPHSSSHGNSWRAVEDAAIDALKQAIAQEHPLKAYIAADRAYRNGMQAGYTLGANAEFEEYSKRLEALRLQIKEGVESSKAQQEQPETWTRHPNPRHHTGPLSEEHLRDVVERTKAMQVALDAWVAQSQSGQTEVPCPLAFVSQEQPAQEPVAYELEAVKFANGKKLVYQKPENLASYIKVRTLVYADADPAPTQPAFTQEPPAKTGARIQAIVTSCLGCTHRRYNSGGIYYCEKLGSDLDPRETFHPLCPLQSL